MPNKDGSDPVSVVRQRIENAHRTAARDPEDKLDPRFNEDLANFLARPDHAKQPAAYGDRATSQDRLAAPLAKYCQPLYHYSP